MRRRKKKLSLRDMELANIGEKFHYVTIDKIPENLAYRGYLEKYVAELGENIRRGVGLLLMGDHDFGKSGAAVCVQKKAMAAGYTTLFLQADRLQKLSIHGTMWFGEMTWMERAETVDLLVLDDLGLEHVKGWGKSVIEGLLRLRSNRRKVTIVTTNKSRENLVKRYGRGVDGILRESFLQILVRGYNWRDALGAEIADRFAKGSKRSSA